MIVKSRTKASAKKWLSRKRFINCEWVNVIEKYVVELNTMRGIANKKFNPRLRIAILKNKYSRGIGDFKAILKMIIDAITPVIPAINNKIKSIIGIEN